MWTLPLICSMENEETTAATTNKPKSKTSTMNYNQKEMHDGKSFSFPSLIFIFDFGYFAFGQVSGRFFCLSRSNTHLLYMGCGTRRVFRRIGNFVGDSFEGCVCMCVYVTYIHAGMYFMALLNSWWIDLLCRHVFLN